VYYLSGDEDILKDELVASVIDAAVDPAARDFNLDIRGAGDLNRESLHTLLETPPMLAERRVAVVRGLEQWRKNAKIWETLREYLARPSPSTVLVLVSGPGHSVEQDIAKRTTHVKLEPPDPDTMRAWAVNRATHAGVSITSEAADHLIACVGSSLAHAAAEIDKLAAAMEVGGTVNVADVEQFVGIRHGETLPDWVDAAVRRDVTEAVRLLDIVLPQPGMNAVRMIIALGGALVGIRLARAVADRRGNQRQVRDALWAYLKRERPRGIGPYSAQVDLWLAGAATWRTSELDDALRGTYETDEQLKSTTISDARATLTTLLLQFGSHKEAA
jgi:DNA polymerase-3 subunit delta